MDSDKIAALGKADEAFARLKAHMADAITDFAGFTGIGLEVIARALDEVNKPGGDTLRNRMIVFGVRQRNLVLAYEYKIAEEIASGKLVTVGNKR